MSPASKIRYRVVDLDENCCRLEILRDTGSLEAGERHTFWCPLGGGYIREITDRRPGTLGRQVCDALAGTGSTLSHFRGRLAICIRREARRMIDREQREWTGLVAS